MFHVLNGSGSWNVAKLITTQSTNNLIFSIFFLYFVILQPNKNLLEIGKKNPQIMSHVYLNTTVNHFVVVDLCMFLLFRIYDTFSRSHFTCHVHWSFGSAPHSNLIAKYVCY